MINRSIAISLWIIFTLPACSNQNDDADIKAPNEEIEPVEPDRGIGDGATSLPEQVDQMAIPAGFRGVWDYEKGNCVPVSDLRVEVGTREIMFYESIGEMRALAREGDNEIVVDLAMSGEGETWEQKTRMTLSENGERLIIEDAEKPRDDPTNIRKRCER